MILLWGFFDHCYRHSRMRDILIDLFLNSKRKSIDQLAKENGISPMKCKTLVDMGENLFKSPNHQYEANHD